LARKAVNISEGKYSMRDYKLLVFLVIFIPLTFLNLNLSSYANNDALFYSEQGDKYYADSKYDLALEAYTKALNSGYMSTYMLNNLGFIYHYEKKDYEKAKEMFEKSLSINPENDWAHFSLSQLYLDMGDLEKGIEEYRNYVDYSKYDKTPINVDRVRELLLERGKSEEEVIAFLNEILNTNPNDYGVLFEIAEYDLKNKQYSKALEEYKKVISLNPHMTIVYAGMGSCYYNLGKYELALEYFKKAKESGHYIPDDFFKAGEIGTSPNLIRKLSPH
jgi:tetratricopeptide (TPR) repeat protein